MSESHRQIEALLETSRRLIEAAKKLLEKSQKVKDEVREITDKNGKRNPTTSS